MSGYKLTYFEVKGLGEPIRMVLHAVGIDFEDKRISFEDWPALKESMPGKKLPILETPDGKVLRESLAICRFISLKNGLYSTEPEEFYRIEMAISMIFEFIMSMAKVFPIKDEKLKEKEIEDVRESHGPRIMNQLQDLLDKSSTGYLADTPKPTLADILLTSTMDFAVDKHDVLLEKFPKLVHHKETIIEHFPKLSDYMKNRPATKF